MLRRSPTRCPNWESRETRDNGIREEDKRATTITNQLRAVEKFETVMCHPQGAALARSPLRIAHTIMSQQ